MEWRRLTSPDPLRRNCGLARPKAKEAQAQARAEPRQKTAAKAARQQPGPRPSLAGKPRCRGAGS